MMPLMVLSGHGLEPYLWWPCLAILGAMLAMDEHSLAQTWFSQPLPACVLAGLLTGDVAAGLAAGLLMQLTVIGNLPVGVNYRLDTVSASVGVTAGAIMAGWHFLDVLTLWSSGPGLGSARWGWILALMAIASLLGGRMVHLERRASLGRMLDGYRSVRDGDLRRLSTLHERGLLMTGMRGALLTVAWALITVVVWPFGPDHFPIVLARAMGFLPYLVPLLAVGSVLERYGFRQSLPLAAAGTVLGFVLVRFIL